MGATRYSNRLARTIQIVSTLMLGFALRLVLLDQRSVWYDEAFSIFLSEKGIADIVRGTAADIQPPLYYILLHYWEMLGDKVFVLRFLSVAFSVLSIALVYVLSRRLFGHRTAIVAVLLTAVAPFQIAYAQELRMYALLEFLLLAYFYFLIRLGETPFDRKMTLFFGLAGAAALYTQTLALFTWIVPILYLVLAREVRAARSVAIGMGIGLVIYLPWIAALVAQIQSVQRSYWVPPPGLAEMFQFFLASTTNLPLPDWMLGIGLFVTLSAIVFVLIGLYQNRRLPREKGVALLVTVWLAPAMLLFIVSYVVRSVFIVRGVMLSTLALLILFAWWITRIKSSRLQTSVLALFVLVLLPAIVYQLSYSQFPRSPYFAATAFLRANFKPGDSIVHDNKMTYLPMHLHDRNIEQEWIADPSNAGSNTLAPETMAVLGIAPTRPEEATEGKNRVWFVIFERAVDEANAQGIEQGNLAWMDKHLVRTEIQRFNDLNVYLFTK